MQHSRGVEFVGRATTGGVLVAGVRKPGHVSCGNGVITLPITSAITTGVLQKKPGNSLRTFSAAWNRPFQIMRSTWNDQFIQKLCRHCLLLFPFDQRDLHFFGQFPTIRCHFSLKSVWKRITSWRRGYPQYVFIQISIVDPGGVVPNWCSAFVKVTVLFEVSN